MSATCYGTRNSTAKAIDAQAQYTTSSLRRAYWRGKRGLRKLPIMVVTFMGTLSGAIGHRKELFHGTFVEVRVLCKGVVVHLLPAAVSVRGK